MAVLTLDRVTKRFGDFTAVDSLSFSVPKGGIFGFLGGNGAGKTTTLRMALDILRPNAGTIEVLGAAPSRDHAGRLGFLPEERGLYRQMTVIDTIVFFGQLKGMSKADARREGLRLVERLGLSEWTKKAVDKLSKGMSQKVQLACALVNAPELLILDEPFSGLDPVNQHVLEDLVLELARTKGATVIFSTHVMQHAERLSDRLLLLSRGRKIFEGTQDEARGRLPSRLSLTSRNDPSGLPGIALATRPAMDAAGWIDWEVQLSPGAATGDLLETCTEQGFVLRRFEIKKPSLHDVFIYLVGNDREDIQ